MIVRTYGRRSRAIQRTFSGHTPDADQDPFSEPLSQETHQDSFYAFSSQDSSSHWPAFDFDPCGPNTSSQGSFSAKPVRSSLDDSLNGVGRKSKKTRVGNREPGVAKSSRPSILATSTLMEAQEFGEMMEHVDEVNFSLDGLRKGQPVRIRRVSLLSLLSICGTTQQRRLLRTQGLAETIIDAVLRLGFDDAPSNLAAATLFYVLTGDGQDDRLLESPDCVRFLIKLLKPMASTAAEDTSLKIGRKLLGFRKDTNVLQDTMTRLNSSASEIVSRVQEILLSCKEIKLSRGDKNGRDRPELCPKWIALLTMEKACLSMISLEETTGAISKSGGNFKEKLRELGGLDAVFEVARDCHSDMEGWISLSKQDAKYEMKFQSLVLLLKCLKIMENATFLSKDNQSHLLEMKGSIDHPGTPLCFTELIISVIKILSGIYLRKCSSAASNNENSIHPDGSGNASEFALMEDCKGKKTLSTSSLINCCSTERISTGNSFSRSQNSQQFSTGWLDNSVSTSETTSTSIIDTCSLKIRLSSSTAVSCSGTSRSSDARGNVTNNPCIKDFPLGRNNNSTDSARLDYLEDSLDPFAFDEDEFAPSKWDLLYGKPKTARTAKSIVKHTEHENGGQSRMTMSKEESSKVENQQLNGFSCTDASNKEILSLVADCLLTAIKVLMNLTNDNPVGCQEIACCGGLETMSSLIAIHFPSFSSNSLTLSDLIDNTPCVEYDHQNDKHLTDQELDFLVAILGLLVNLVEKDSKNRSCLAAASVSLHGLRGGLEESQENVIPLICSIFLANQGAGEGGGGEQHLPWNDEEAVLEGEKEAEKMIVEAYAALLLAFLSTESKDVRNAIADCLPGRNLAVLVPVLDRFLAFHLTLNMISPETHEAVSEVIESLRIP